MNHLGAMSVGHPLWHPALGAALTAGFLWLIWTANLDHVIEKVPRENQVLIEEPTEGRP